MLKSKNLKLFARIYPEIVLKQMVFIWIKFNT